jgi:transposase InsO family protein
MVYRGWSMRRVARHFDYHHTAVMRWVRRARGFSPFKIPTLSSRPEHHPRALPEKIVDAIIKQRIRRRRCAEVVHQELLRQGIVVSLSSVKRTLKRSHLLRERSPWKRYHAPISRPYAEKPGDLVQIDTIHIITVAGERFYIYTLIDVCSRWAYAKVYRRINTHASFQFVRLAQKAAGFQFKMIQSDHGSEFSTTFTLRLGKLGARHRHSRIRQSNDNAHVERFNRTVQEECLDNVLQRPIAYQRALRVFMPYYNSERLHMGIKYKTPLEVVLSY